LWGRAMAKINWDEASKLVWSTLSVEDFVQSRSKSEDLPTIISKLEENYSEGKIFMAVYNNTPQSSIAIIKVSTPETTTKILSEIPGKSNYGFLEIKIENPNIIEVGQIIAEKIKNLLTK